MRSALFVLFLALLLLLFACAPAARQENLNGEGKNQGQIIQGQRDLKALAVETFLADIAQNVAGDRLVVESLIPVGVDAHAFEPTPRDLARIAESHLLIVNGAGFESWLEEALVNAGGQGLVIEASAGLQGRKPGPGEQGDESVDPHFWLDPNLAARYAENIRAGLIQIDPQGEQVYTQNTTAYLAKLNELDVWIQAQVAQIPVERRILVTNHESLGYFADRYGFTIIGAILPGQSTSASPSARQLARLVEAIRASGAPAIFLERGSNPQLAEQIASETGVKVIDALYTESLSAPDGPAPNYIEMMKTNTKTIVEALK